MDDLLEALRTLSNVDPGEARSLVSELDLSIDPDSKPDEILAAALNGEASGVWHAIQNQGYAAARGKYESEAKSARKEAEKAREEVERLQSEVKELSKDDPDIERIKKEASKKIQAAQERAVEKASEAEQKIGQMLVSQKRNTLENRLNDVFKSRTMAKAFAQIHSDRFEPDLEGETPSVNVLQQDSDIPFSPVGDRSPLDLLIEEIRSEADPSDLKSSTDTGGGERSGGGTLRSGSLLDQAAEEGKKMAEESTNRSDSNWIDRMGSQL